MVTYSGPEEGKGAQVQWTSQVESVGTGSMEINESEPNHTIDLAVNFNGLDGTSSYESHRPARAAKSPGPSATIRARAR